LNLNQNYDKINTINKMTRIMMEKTKRNLRMKFGESIIENREKIQSKDILKNIQTDDEVT